MTYVSKFRRAGGLVVAVYTCSVHGEIDAEVERDDRGDAPDVIACPIDDDCPGCGGQPSAPGGAHCNVCDGRAHAPCGLAADWTPSALVGCRVRRVEVTRGRWEKPERPTYLDTRKLGEGQSMEEFQAERKKVWQRKREAEVMAIKKGFI